MNLLTPGKLRPNFIKHSLLVLSFTISHLWCFSQFDFSYDPIEKRNQRDIRNIDSLFKVSKQGDFQLLFWILPRQEGRRTLLVLTNTNQQWHARYFERRKEGSTLAWIELPVSQAGLETLWDGLARNDVLHLKSSEEIKDFSFSPVDGGVLYYFELMDKTGKRAYYYDCPKHQQLRNDHKELNRVINMIQLLNDFTKEKERTIC